MSLKRRKPQRDISYAESDMYLTASYHCRINGGCDLYNRYETGLFTVISKFTFQPVDNIVEILKKKRMEANKLSRNYDEKIEIDEQIFNVICGQICPITEFPQNLYLDVIYLHNLNRELLRNILTDWSRYLNKYENFITNKFRKKIIEGIMKCIKNDNDHILGFILKFGDYNKLINDPTNPRNNEIIDFIDYSAKCNSFHCCRLLFRDLDWSKEFRPSCLLNAIKYTQNIDLINMMIDFLEKSGTAFICDQIMTEIIKSDLDSIAKRILINRWHKLSKKDLQFAKEKDLDCNVLFKEREHAFNCNKHTYNDENTLDLSDKEWGNDSDWDTDADTDYSID